MKNFFGRDGMKNLLFQNKLSGFDLTTCDSYFTILVEVFMDRILSENTCFMNHVE